MPPKLLSNKEKEREMRKNIILHRRKVVSFLEEVFNVNLKRFVKSNPFELLEMDMFDRNKVKNFHWSKIKIKEEIEEHPLKKEIIEPDSFNDNESDVSVGSYEPWNNDCQTPNFENDKDSNRRSSRLIMNRRNYRKYNDSIYDYSDDSAVSDTKEKQSKNLMEQMRCRMTRNRKGLGCRGSQLRKEHNAKERMCRSVIGKLFAELGNCCSYLDTTRRVPSKHSVLTAAKKECDSLKMYERKLIVEKEVWKLANEHLQRRLKAGSVPSGEVLIDN